MPIFHVSDLSFFYYLGDLSRDLNDMHEVGKK